MRRRPRLSPVPAGIACHWGLARMRPSCWSRPTEARTSVACTTNSAVSIGTRTVEPRSPTNPRVSGSARCGASRRPPTCNGSRRYTGLCRISLSRATSDSGRGTTACSESGRRRMGCRTAQERAWDAESSQHTLSPPSRFRAWSSRMRGAVKFPMSADTTTNDLDRSTRRSLFKPLSIPVECDETHIPASF